jgi:hypothetical protein
VAIAESVLKTRGHNDSVSQMIVLATIDRLVSSLIADIAGIILEAC